MPSLVKPQVTVRANRLPLFGGVAIGIWLSFLLYADTLGIPYLQEDVFHLRWLSGIRHPLEPFWNAENAPAYRPLGKAIIKGWELVLGEHLRWWLRWHNLVFNALNIALVGVLGSWLDGGKRRFWTGGVSAMLFATYPFAYQAIPWINNFFYPLIVLFLLGMTVVYWKARSREYGVRSTGSESWWDGVSVRYLVIALVLCGLAPFEIEYGVMGSGLLFLVEIVFWVQGRQKAPWLGAAVLGLVMNAFYVVIWFTIPKASYGFGGPTLERVYQISSYFVQGATYPVSWVARLIEAGSGLDDLQSIWVVAGPMVCLLVGWLAWKRRWGLVVAGVLWFGLVNLPALVFVDFGYVINSPRLIYPAGVAVVWVWGCLIANFGGGFSDTVGHSSHGWTRFFLILNFSFLIFCLFFGGRFVRERMGLYHAITPVVLDMVEEAGVIDTAVRVVNYPSWMQPRENTFVLGNHGIQLLPFYIGISEVVFGHNGVDGVGVETMQFRNIQTDQPYFYGMHGEIVDYEGVKRVMEAGERVYLTEYDGLELDFELAGGLGHSETFDSEFGSSLRFQNKGVVFDEGGVTADLVWEVVEAVEDLTVFVHLYDADGALVAQDDGYPVGGMSPFWLWAAGAVIEDRRVLDWGDLPAGVYRVGVGVYDPVSGMRVEAFDGDGVRVVDDVLILGEVKR